MGSHTLKALLLRLNEDSALLAKFSAPGADAIAIAADAGFDIDENDLRALPELLSDAELEGVAGGNVFKTQRCNW